MSEHKWTRANMSEHAHEQSVQPFPRANWLEAWRINRNNIIIKYNHNIVTSIKEKNLRTKWYIELLQKRRCLFSNMQFQCLVFQLFLVHTAICYHKLNISLWASYLYFDYDLFIQNIKRTKLYQKSVVAFVQQFIFSLPLLKLFKSFRYLFVLWSTSLYLFVAICLTSYLDATSSFSFNYYAEQFLLDFITFLVHKKWQILYGTYYNYLWSYANDKFDCSQMISILSY